MAKEGGYTIKDISDGGYSALNPPSRNYSPGFYVPARRLGTATIPGVQQVQGVTKVLSQGVVPIEVGALKPEEFQSIPKQHFEEIDRLAKLTGAKISVHAPVMEPSGLGEKGWDPISHQLAIREFEDVVDKTVRFSRNKEPVPITIHASSIAGSDYFKNEKGEKQQDVLIAINREDNKLVPFNLEREHYSAIERVRISGLGNLPISTANFDEKGFVPQEEFTPQQQLSSKNKKEWEDAIDAISFQKDKADEIIENHYPAAQDVYHHLLLSSKGDSKKMVEDKLKLLSGEQQDIITRVQTAEKYLDETQTSVNSFFGKAYKYANEEDKERLNELLKLYSQEVSIIENENKINPLNALNLQKKSRALQTVIDGLKEVTPEIYVPVETFALEKSSETFAKVAFNSWSKYKDNAPMINIEAVAPGMPFYYGSDLKKLVEKSQEEFVKLAKNNGVSESVAKRKAEELIGVTWDLGHANLMKKKGFTDEDILREQKEIAKHVKHVHVADNFGFSDSHLPPGFGNVPNKELIQQLEKEGFNGRVIVEAGSLISNFHQSPVPYSLAGMSSPMYSTGDSPYWDQTSNLISNYYGGLGEVIPEQNFQTMGAGFSTLPHELGGFARGSPGSRFSGRPME